MLVVDFMHEFELGVWKALFSHLIRMLYSLPNGVALVQELDKRYRGIPTFGKDTIRRFANNASEMKKLGARDFEDLLQCSIPVFEGLFPYEDNKRLMKLLFRLCEWHGFAKLRMQTEPTSNHLKSLTTELGVLMRDFQHRAANYETYELDREKAARQRQETRDAIHTGGSTIRGQSAKRRKTLNLNTYKWHALGDYPSMIPRVGPSDIYSTQLVSTSPAIIM